MLTELVKVLEEKKATLEKELARAAKRNSPAGMRRPGAPDMR